MEGHLITVDGERHDVTPAAVQALIASSTRFWLDLTAPAEPDVTPLLRDTFGFHPLAVEDAEQFGQRPKLDEYDGYAVLIVFGATAAGSLVELHCFYTETFLVTVHREPCPELAQLGERLERRAWAHPHHLMLLYRVVDVLVDGYFPVLSDLDDRIDALEDEILARPTDEQLGRLFDMKRSLIAMRKVVTPQRDLFASLVSGDGPLPGMTHDAERYFRDVYDHLIRISDLVDSYRDLLSGALDTHLSTVSNRLNVVMKQLTIIATIFLPLSFLTGFFGQNFGWMVTRITAFPAFLGVGVGLPVLAVVGLLALFRQRGWLSADGAPKAPPARRHRPGADRRWHVLHPGDRTPAAPGGPG